MTFQNLIELARKKIAILLLAGALLAAGSFLFLVISQKNFRADTDILIAQNQANVSNYYAYSQSADYLTSLLTQSIYSQKFLSEVGASGKVSSPFVFGDSTQQLKEWKKIVAIKNNSNLGIMSVTIYADSSQQATEISNAVVNVLTNDNSFFLGQGQNVGIRILSGPLVEKNPTFSQIAMSAGGGFVIGVLLVLLWEMYREERKNKESLAADSKEASESNPNHNSQPVAGAVAEKLYLSENSEYWKQRLESHS